jgi:iron(III) transport system ATP-binding protein
MPTSLDVRDLRKQFGTGRPAVDGVSFHVPTGEIVVLLGPSGCGKTTTLRCVAGLEYSTSGRISIGGRLVSSPADGVQLPARLRNIGMVFQSYAVWPHMTVRQNVAYPLRHRRIPRTEIERKTGDVLALVGLSEFADRSVVSLSGGQMQRVALARSLVYEPQLLLLDEPLSNLDAQLRLRLRDDLRRIIKQAGVTAVYVTHDQAEAVVLGDRIGVMRDGKLLQLATPDEIYNRPADLFVANFTGASSLIAGRVLERNGEFGIVETGGHRLTAMMPSNVKSGERSAWHAWGDGARQSVHRARRRSALSRYADHLRARGAWRPAGSARAWHQYTPCGRQRGGGRPPAYDVLGLPGARRRAAGVARKNGFCRQRVWGPLQMGECAGRVRGPVGGQLGMAASILSQNKNEPEERV